MGIRVGVSVRVGVRVGVSKPRPNLRGQRGHLGEDLELVRHGERLLALLERECLAHRAIEGGGRARLVRVRVRVLGAGVRGRGRGRRRRRSAPG